MSKCNALWAVEVAKHGMRNALIDRAKFHGGLTLCQVVTYTGYTIATCKKWLLRLEQEGYLCDRRIVSDDIHWRYKDTSARSN